MSIINPTFRYEGASSEELLGAYLWNDKISGTVKGSKITSKVYARSGGDILLTYFSDMFVGYTESSPIDAMRNYYFNEKGKLSQLS